MKLPKKSVLLLLLVAVLLSTSCFRRDGNRTVLLPYVQRLVSDTTSVQFDVLQRVNPKSKSGAITVLGEPTDVVRLTEALLRCDRFNNIDGSLSPDGLPDFAGEVIAPVLDAANAPYAPYMEAGNEEFLRELHVRNFLSVMDTTCVFSPFDLEDRLPKPSAKVLVLASSLSAEYGEADIDTLCAIAGKPIPVVSSVGAMIGNVLQAHAPDCHLPYGRYGTNWEPAFIPRRSAVPHAVPPVSRPCGVSSRILPKPSAAASFPCWICIWQPAGRSR